MMRESDAGWRGITVLGTHIRGGIVGNNRKMLEDKRISKTRTFYTWESCAQFIGGDWRATPYGPIL